MNLHEQIVGRRAAIDAELGELEARIRFHGAQHLCALERDRLQRGTCEMRAGRAAGEPEDRAARVGVPVRRTQAGERGYEIHAAVVGHARGQCFDFRCGADDLEPVAQPLHR